MKITLNVNMADGSTQSFAYDMPPGAEIIGYSVDVNGFRVSAPMPPDKTMTADRDQVDRIVRNGAYGKTGAGKAAAAVDLAAGASNLAADICGCGNPQSHPAAVFPYGVTRSPRSRGFEWPA